ncbi:SDR family oxidoreductase [uncultured Sulfitobacter sp.]|uniref:SDR family oxidoreductase n=1 Tax=uncultured Sulfitobacter sp. TaxID=191468 RepID=UPI002599D782|nr:SDR family oxidoreductase [uncultured Sulfitobacter sp.]
MKTKTIVITGATGGIGTATVARCLADGHRVIAADHTEIAQPEGASYENFLPIQFDIRSSEACQAAIEDAVEAFGGIDTLVNVAGICYGGGPDTADIDEWDKTFDVNVKGVFQLTKFALPQLARNPRADIVNISSIWGTDHTHALLSYSASKFAVEGYTGGLRQWGMSRNVRVCTIQVDKVNTGFRENLGAAGEFPPEKLAKMLRPEDVASAVSFVMSSSATAQISSMRLDAPLWYQD